MTTWVKPLRRYDDDEERIVRDGESIRVPFHMMDSTQRAIAKECPFRTQHMPTPRYGLAEARCHGLADAEMHMPRNVHLYLFTDFMGG
jgi:hypothetical protein